MKTSAVSVKRKVLKALVWALLPLAVQGCVALESALSPLASQNAVVEPIHAPTTEILQSDAPLDATRTFDWFDATRERKIPARLYLPASRAAGAHSMPLVVFSHGLGGSREGYQYLGRYFAANGYASLHLQHIGSDRELWFGNPLNLFDRLKGAATESEAIARVSDLRFALDKLLSSDLGEMIDPRRIVAAGHSYGANTTMLAAGATIERDGQLLQMRDDRIKAAILLSAPPFYGLGDPHRILNGIAIPTLHVTATEDDIRIPGYCSGVADRIRVYQATGIDRQTPKALVVFKGGSHSIFTDRTGSGGYELNKKVKAATRELALTFMNNLLGNGNGAVDQWREKNADILEQFETWRTP